MGAHVLNLSVGTDWATGDNERFVEIHMRLSISKDHFDRQNILLAKDDWSGAAELLIKAYPEYESIIRSWFSGSERRSLSEKRKPKKHLVAAK